MSPSIAVITSRRRRRGASSGITVTDTFTRANNASSLGSTESPVLPWTAGSGTWGVISNQAYAPVAGGDVRAWVDAGFADGTVTATIAAVGSGQGAVLARVSNNTNCIRFVYSGALIFLQKIVAGATTTLGTTGYATAPGDVYTLDCRGTSLSASVNGVVKLTATDAFNASATKWGLETNATDVRLDTFSVAP